MNLYDEFYPLAVEMLEEFGTDATLSSTAPAVTSPDAKRAGRATPVTALPVSRPVRVVVGPISVEGADGRRTLRSVATMLSEPRRGDTLHMGDLSWTIDAVTKVAPQSKAIVFMAEVS